MPAFNNTAPRYFETMHTPVVLGREFTAHDDVASLAVAIVNEAFVRRHLPDRNPLGAQLHPEISQGGRQDRETRDRSYLIPR